MQRFILSYHCCSENHFSSRLDVNFDSHLGVTCRSMDAGHWIIVRVEECVQGNYYARFHTAIFSTEKCTLFLEFTYFFLQNQRNVKCRSRAPDHSGWSRTITIQCPSVRPSSSTISNIYFSKTTGPIIAKFYVEPLWVGGTKVCSRHLGHMSKMAAKPIYGKNFKNLLRNQWIDFNETWYVASRTPAHYSSCK